MGGAVVAPLAVRGPAPNTITSTSRAATMLNAVAQKMAARAIRLRTSEGATGRGFMTHVPVWIRAKEESLDGADANGASPDACAVSRGIGCGTTALALRISPSGAHGAFFGGS